MPPPPSRASGAPLVLAVLLILLATLFPQRVTNQPPFLCLYCGEGGIADGILNVGLFLPLGMALAWRYRGAMRLIAAGAALSALVELAQTHIPGRDPSLSDILSNTLGTALGVALAGRGRALESLLERHRAALSVAACLFALLGVSASGALLGPAYPRGAYWVRWGTAVHVEAPFDGQVEEASAGPVKLWPGPSNRGGRVRAALAAGSPLRAEASVRRLPDGMAAVLGVSRGQTDVAVLGLDGKAAVARFSTRGLDWGLRQPEVLSRHTMAGIRIPGRLRIQAWRSGRGYCLDVNGRRDCTLGFTVGVAWRMLLQPVAPGGTVGHLLDLLWMAALFLPAGLLLPGRRSRLLLSALALATIWALPLASGILPSPPSQYLAALAGVWCAAPLHAGISAWRRGRRRAGARSARSERS